MLAEGLDHPEGVAVGADGALYAGGEDGQIYRIDPDAGTWEQIASSPGRFFLGVAVDAENRVFACDMNGCEVVVFDPKSGAWSVWCDSASGTPLRCPNWAAFDSTGTMWLTDSGSVDKPDGSLIRIARNGGEAERLDLGPMYYPNGCAVDRDGSVLVVESFLPGVTRVDAGGRTVATMLPDTVPDGIALLADGGFLVSCFQPNRILLISPSSDTPAVLLDDWTGQSLLTPTNMAFYGSDLDRIAISSLCGGYVASATLPARGVELHRPSLRD